MRSRIFKSETRRFSRPRPWKLEQIAIDEICIGLGPQYLTVVPDLRTGTAVFVDDSKGAEALVPFWKRLKGIRAKIPAVAIDMSPAYISAVHDKLLRVAMVFDHFPIVKLYNEKMPKLRRRLYREACSNGDKDVIKVPC